MTGMVDVSDVCPFPTLRRSPPNHPFFIVLEVVLHLLRIGQHSKALISGLAMGLDTMIKSVRARRPRKKFVYAEFKIELAIIVVVHP